MKQIYVDYASTTPLDPRVLEAIKPFYTNIYGNPSSINNLGVEARTSIEAARKTISKFMNTEPDNLIFTGSATEANNLVLKGLMSKVYENKTCIAVSTVEHASIINVAKWLGQQGSKIKYISVDQFGLLDLGELENALRKGISLVSIIHANNETGTIQSLKEIGALCHEYGTLVHTDAAQSFGKIPIDVKKMNIDFMTVNAHKIYGPKGVGGLFIEDRNIIEPLLHGGGQEFGLRSSTENVPGIMGFARAVELRKEEMNTESRVLTRLGNRLVKNILQIEETYLSGHPTKRLPNIANFRFSYIEGESLVLLLNDEGIAAATGSACSSHLQEPSHVLLAMRIKSEAARGSLRLSIGKYNSTDEIDFILEVLPRTIEKLRKISPLGRKIIPS